MCDDEQGKVSSEGRPPNVDARAIPIRLLPHADMELRLVNDVTVNFTGDEFLVTFSQALPPVFRGLDEFPDEVMGKVLFRAAFTPRKWAEAVDSIADQVERLRRAGILPERMRDGKEQ